MKSLYLTDNNINRQSENFLRQIGRFPINTRVRFNLQESALLVLDMQDFFLNSSSHAYIPSAVAIIERINLLIRLYKQHHRPVICTEHINSLEDAGMMSVRWREIITSDNPLYKISSDIDIGDSEVMRKTQYDAFHDTGLDALLRLHGVKQVTVTGVMANLCCETTARNAFVRGFAVFFPADTCAAYNEEFHLATLRNLAFGFADIVTSQWILEQIGRD